MSKLPLIEISMANQSSKAGYEEGLTAGTMPVAVFKAADVMVALH